MGPSLTITTSNLQQCFLLLPDLKKGSLWTLPVQSLGKGETQHHEMGFGLMAVRSVVGRLQVVGFAPVGFVAARGMANQAQGRGEVPDKDTFVAQQLIKEGEEYSHWIVIKDDFEF